MKPLQRRNPAVSIKKRLVAVALGLASLSATPAFADGYQSYPLQLATGWNMIGNNIYNRPVDVGTVFGNTSQIASVWKWLADSQTWAFYAPDLDANGTLASYCASKGYSVLSTIDPGEGYWVNTKQAVNLGIQSGKGLFLGGAAFVPGWNMVATAADVGPAAFNRSLSSASGSQSCPDNLTTLWAWDANTSLWYFYAPNLDCAGTLSSYIQSRGYEDFRAQTTGKGKALWVNTPAAGVPSPTNSYFLQPGAYSTYATGVVIYSKNVTYDTSFPLPSNPSVPTGSTITNVQWSYHPDSQPAAFSALLCWSDGTLCVAANSQSGGSQSFNGASASRSFLMRFRVAGTGALFPSVIVAPIQVTVQYDYPVSVGTVHSSTVSTSATTSALSSSRTTSKSTGPSSGTGKTGTGKTAPPTPGR